MDGAMAFGTFEALAGGDPEVVVEFDAKGAVAGSVSGLMAGDRASVVARPSVGDSWKELCHGSTAEVSNGSFHFASLMPGDHRLTLVITGDDGIRLGAHANVSVTSGQTARCNLTASDARRRVRIDVRGTSDRRRFELEVLDPTGETLWRGSQRAGSTLEVPDRACTFRGHLGDYWDSLDRAGWVEGHVTVGTDAVVTFDFGAR
jgi:hypothetical protein